MEGSGVGRDEGRDCSSVRLHSSFLVGFELM
jgi:hypothetical protein